MKYENEFRADINKVNLILKGNFLLTEKDNNFFKLFSSLLVKNCIINAIKKPSLNDNYTQTLIPQQIKYNEIDIYNNDENEIRFLNLISSNYSQRLPKSFTWILYEIHEIYDSKSNFDEVSLQNKSKIMKFPEFIISYSQKKFKIPFQAEQYCWDLYNTCMKHKGRTSEIDFFIEFLFEILNEEQLAFFIKMRAKCMINGYSVIMHTNDCLETFVEYFLSQNQIENILPFYDKIFLNSIIEMSISRPAIYLESTKRYIAMHNILRKCVEYYYNDSLNRFENMLNVYKIKSKISNEKFIKIIKMFFNNITYEQINKFVKIFASKSKNKNEISLKEFVKKFQLSSLLYSFNKKEDFDIELLNVISEQWNKIKYKMDDVLTFLNSQFELQPENLSLKTILDEIRKYLMNLKHLIIAKDPKQAVVQLYLFLLCIDLAFATLKSPEDNFESLEVMECCIRENWIK